MLPERGWMRVCSTVVACALVIASGAAFAEDDPADPGEDPSPAPVKLVGGTSLLPPEGAENQDATGGARLVQWGERIAVHVKVRHLEAGTTYDVAASRTVEDPAGGAPTVEEDPLGTITTRDAVPPAPRCFNACLKPPAEEPPAEEPAPEDGDAGEGGWLLDRLRQGDRDPRPRPAPFCSGTALFYVDREGTSLGFRVSVRGVESPVTGMRIVDAEGNEVLGLPVGETLRGAVDVTAEQLAALAGGETVLVVTTEDPSADPPIEGETLQGKVQACFSFLDSWRARIFARLAGTGALCLDTKREDAMPFGVTDIRDLVGVTITVRSGDTAVLAGTVDAVKEIIPWHRRTREPAPPPEEPVDPGTDPGTDPDTDPGADLDGIDPAEAATDDGAGGSLDDVAAALALADSAVYFDVGEAHDASFIRGDANDDGSVDITDPIFVLLHLFRGGAHSYCPDAADADDSGAVDLSDPILTLQVLFQGRSDLPAPYPERGFDPTADTLFCSGA